MKPGPDELTHVDLQTLDHGQEKKGEGLMPTFEALKEIISQID